MVATPEQLTAKGNSRPAPAVQLYRPNDFSSASAAIPPCVVPVCNELVTCRLAVNPFERQHVDRAVFFWITVARGAATGQDTLRSADATRGTSANLASVRRALP